ncbi:MAG: DUF2339 domain-containing protein [Betaproteobacteria bacterium]|nr:MAG: DUF2339 domain-containing protein [Betaproteobacteria bacterium]
MPWILGIFGLLIGAGIAEFWGALALGAAGAWLGLWLKRQGQQGESAPPELRLQVLSLTRRVAQLEALMANLSPASAVAAAVAPATPAAAAGTEVPLAEIREAPSPEPAPAAANEPAAPASAAARGESVELPQPNRLWNWFFGGNALVRIGVLVLFFGVAFLVRYAAEHVDVPIEARLAGIALGAMAMLIVGWRLRERAGGYGLVLQGGGVGVLYLVVFGAFRIWKLVPPELAFALLVVIALASAILAIAQDSRSLASAGITGGFLAPLLASTGQGSHVALFSFYVVLDLGVLFVAWHKAWRALNLLGFVFTFGIGTFWGGSYYRPELYDTTQPFLIVFFLLYVAIAVLYALRRAPRLNDYVDSVLVFGTPLVAAALQLALVREMQYGAAWSAVALGAFYCLAAYQLWRLQRETLQLLVECFIALGVAFATLAIPYAFDGQWTAASWALEGAAALWVGTRQNRSLPRLFGLLLQPAAGVAFLAGAHAAAPAATPILNSGFAGGLSIALSGLFCAWHGSRHRFVKQDLDQVIAAVLLVWGTIWWLATGWHEIEAFAQPEAVRSLQLAYASASALAFVALRHKLDWVAAAYAALALLPVMAIWGLGWHERHPHPFAAYGFAAWPAAFVALYWVLLRVENDAPEPIFRTSHCLALWLLALLGGWECAWQLDAAVGEGRIWSDIGRPLVPALLAAWIATRRGEDHWPFAAHLRTYLAYALAPVMAALWFWVLYINFKASGDPRPLPYLPLLNPLDVAVALLAVVFQLWWRALQRIAVPPLLAQFMAAVPLGLGATGFIWANGVLLRTLHHWAEVPFRLDAMWRSALVQASFSVFWSALALGAMVLANRRRLRPVWMCGAALLAVVVVKLFLLDLQKIGGIERIVSFLGVGVLLLVIGYLAPVPPRKEAQS